MAATLCASRANRIERGSPTRQRDRDMTDISPLDQARILSEALPHMQQYDEETIVIKYGGHAMGAEDTAKAFARDIVLLEQTAINPVVVHGGGPQIGEMLNRLGIKSEFAAGLRVTDKASMEVVEMVLAGAINKQIVGFINSVGGKAVGLCGKDANMVRARKVTRSVFDPETKEEREVDLGFVGEPETVDTTVLDQIIGRRRRLGGGGRGPALQPAASLIKNPPRPLASERPLNGRCQARLDTALCVRDHHNVEDLSAQLHEVVEGTERPELAK